MLSLLQICRQFAVRASDATRRLSYKQTGLNPLIVAHAGHLLIWKSLSLSSAAMTFSPNRAPARSMMNKRVSEMPSKGRIEGFLQVFPASWACLNFEQKIEELVSYTSHILIAVCSMIDQIPCQLNTNHTFFHALLYVFDRRYKIVSAT